MEEPHTGLLPPLATLIRPECRPRITAYVASDPFGLQNAKHHFAPGVSIADIVRKTCPVHVLTVNPVVFLGDSLVYPQFWSHMRPKAGTTLAIRVLPEGSGGFLKAVLSIAVFAAAAYFAPGLAAGLSGSFLPGGATALQVGLAKAAISGVGMLAVNAIVRPPKPRMNDLSSVTGKKESPTMFIQGARNQIAPYGKLRIVLGKHRLVPYQAAKPYLETAGDKQFVRQLFDWGLGKIALSDLRIGDTALTNFTGVELQHVLNGNSSAPMSLFANSADEEGFNLHLTNAASWLTKTTVPEADEIVVDVTWPAGLYKIDSNGGIKSTVTQYEIRYSPAGAGTWTTFAFQETRSSRVAVRVSQRFAVARGQYDVQVRRISPDDADRTSISRELYWTALRSFTYRAPVTRDGLCLTALRMQGTDQLNGYVDQLSGLVSQIIPDYDAGTESWVERETSNPASLLRFVLQSEFNPAPIADNRVMLAVLEDWHSFCVANGLAYNGVVDFGSNVDDVLQEIAAAGRASIHRPDGKYSVVIDRPQDFSEAHLVTPRNSWGYEYERVYPDVPHALIVEFLNEDKDFERDQRFVYDDGYNKDGSGGLTAASKFERWEMPGVTNADLIWKFGRWRLAEMRLRPDAHSFSQDIEHLVINCGNPVDFGHDVPLSGLGSGRIKNVGGDPFLDEAGDPILDEAGDPIMDESTVTVHLDEPMTMEAGKTYSLRWRRKNGLKVVKTVQTVVGTQTELSFSESVSAAEAPEGGDLFAFYETERLYLQLIPRTIEAGKDWSGRLTCVNAAPEIYEAADGPIPEFVSSVSRPAEWQRPSAPVKNGDVLSDEMIQVLNVDGSISSRMVIPLLNRNIAPVLPVVKIRQAGDSDFGPASIVFTSPEAVVLTDLAEGAAYDIEIRYRKADTPLVLASNLFSLPLTLSNVTFIGESSNPADVVNYAVSVRNGTAFFGWDRNREIDLHRYEMRFTPDEGADQTAWDASAPVDLDIGKGITRYETPAQRGTYLLKAVDRGGRKSETAAFVNIATDALTGLSLVETIAEHADWGGTHDGTAVVSGTLRLDTGESEGYYYFEDVFDNGSVDTFVLNALLETTGLNSADSISSWASIAARESISGTAASQYNVTLQLRSTNDATGGTPSWTPWSDFTVGDLTRRGIALRLYLQSLEDGVTPVVSAATVNIYEQL